MQIKTISEIEGIYDLELERIAREIQKIDIFCPSRTRGVLKVEKQKAKKVLLQFPDGMKPYSTSIAEYLEKKTNAELFIWMGSCFGACDTPKVEGFDLLVQFGHSSWKN